MPRPTDNAAAISDVYLAVRSIELGILQMPNNAAYTACLPINRDAIVSVDVLEGRSSQRLAHNAAGIIVRIPIQIGNAFSLAHYLCPIDADIFNARAGYLAE